VISGDLGQGWLTPKNWVEGEAKEEEEFTIIMSMYQLIHKHMTILCSVQLPSTIVSNYIGIW